MAEAVNKLNHSTYKSRQEDIKHASAEIIDFIKKFNPETHTDILFDIKLCIEEAVRNAIIHGNKSREEQPVDIYYYIDDNRIVIKVADKGAGFKVSDIPDPTQEENLYKESGRGVYIMHKLMDRVEYSGKGNVVVMEKRLS